MIGEIAFNGYRFYEESRISFVADRRVKKLLSNSVLVDNRPILKSVGLYGGNNSGKTNIVSLLKMLKKVLLGEDKICFNSSVFEDSKVTSCSIIYNNIDGNGWMEYEFSFDHRAAEFIKERVSRITYRPTGNPKVDDVLFLDRPSRLLKVYGEDKSRYLDLIVGRKPLIYSVRVDEGEFKALEGIKKSFEAAASSIEIIDLYNIPIEKTIEVMKSGDKKKSSFIESFVRHADISIDGFGYLSAPSLDGEIDEAREKALAGYEKVVDVLRLTTTYGTANVPSILYDSAGTKKIEAVASYIYDALSEGKTLVIDEMDNGLHFMLTRAIVSLFNNIANDSGQLFFTAHDLLLVDSKSLMRKEQIYFLSRDKKKARLHCLGDYTVASSGLREGDDLLKRYSKGDFGGVPSPSFIKELLMLRK